MNNYELAYGTGIKTEFDVVKLCLTKIAIIKEVIDTKGINCIETYLYERASKLKESE